MDYWARSQAKESPGLSSALEPLVDLYGQEVTKDPFGDWALDFANKFIFPGTVNVKNRSLIDGELIRVYESTGNVDILPTAPQKYVTYNKVKYPMTAKQYTQYSEEYGQAVYAAIKTTVTSSGYRSSNDEKKADLLKKAIEKAESTVRDSWKIKLSDAS